VINKLLPEKNLRIFMMNDFREGEGHKH
jgi:hypothetical protein